MVKSRTYGQELIANSLVKVNNEVITKASFSISENDVVQIIEELYDYASRSALKLKAAIEHFKIALLDKVVLDIGSSTGGFTDFCLRSGCKKVYAVDVGTKQLLARLKENPKVIVKENTDIRNIDKKDIEEIDFICCDVSFISLRLIMAKISELSNNDCAIICLFKPQYEVGLKLLSKKGIVKDKTAVKKCLTEFLTDLKGHNLVFLDVIKSPILGKDGNQEYLLYLKQASANHKQRFLRKLTTYDNKSLC